MRVGLVPVGYADGYLRAFSNKAVMLLDGENLPRDRPSQHGHDHHRRHRCPPRNGWG